MTGESSPLIAQQRIPSRQLKEKSLFFTVCGGVLAVVCLFGVALRRHDAYPPQSRFAPSDHVVQAKPGFPSFLDYAGSPIAVSYDERSILLNGTRVLLLGGSMHPVRNTRQTWEHQLDEAVHQGLNLITLYVMWSWHQPKCASRLDWNIVDDWDLKDAIVSAGQRGLFVHLRLGPYVCAEYSYGGIPEWLALTDPTMRMRRPNKPWLDAMEGFVRSTVDYIKSHALFADQGGPIVLGQIENELNEGDAVDKYAETSMYVDESLGLVDRQKCNMNCREADIHDYAEWCGDLVQRLVPTIVWTMCQGLSARMTISTYNGMLHDTQWLDQHGNGRIQIDQPALWTEDEGKQSCL